MGGLSSKAHVPRQVGKSLGQNGGVPVGQQSSTHLDGKKNMGRWDLLPSKAGF